MREHIPVITVDGPSATGKGTVSQLLAKKLRWHLLASGLLYRALALAIRKHQVDSGNDVALEVFAANIDVQFKVSGVGMPAAIILEGEDVTEALQTEEVAMTASQIAIHPKVRNALLGRQRAFREKPGLIAEGRDMGTVVFPDADLKIYLDASFDERVRRRFFQLKEHSNDVSLDRVFSELKARDERDMHRLVAPLRPAADALIVDTTQASVENTLKLILQEVHRRFSLVYDEAN